VKENGSVMAKRERARLGRGKADRSGFWLNRGEAKGEVGNDHDKKMDKIRW